jgi:acyl-CoA dehydrogenase
MATALFIVLIAVTYSILLYIRASLFLNTVAAFIYLVLIMQWSEVDVSWIYINVFIFLLIFVPLNIPAFRRLIFSNHLLSVYRKKMPSISSTEQAAIDAGTVWWDGELFSGRPDWKKLLSLPAPKLSEKEQAFINGPVEELCRMIDDWQITQVIQDLPEDAWDFIKEKGFFGMIIPEKYGGLEFSALAHSEVVMKVASRSVSAAVTVMVPNSLGPAELLMRYGTKEQKDYYLPRLARGEEVPCFALTGPEAGSDAASMPDSGIVCKGEFKGNKDVLGIRLNWEKRYITLGPIATVLGLAFKLYDPEHLLGDRENIGITLALIPTDTPGITIGNRHYPLDSAFLVGPNWGKDVFVPIESIIGGPARAGEGWRMLMDCLSEGRSISLPALSTSSSKLASRFIGAYARIRKQFNMPLGRFEGVEEALARIAGYTFMSDSARTLTAVGVDQGEEPAVISAIVKYNLTELGRKVVNDAMDISGGAGICMGPRNIMGRIYQSIPISITVEGANILTRNMIVFGQGIIRGHPYLLKEVNAAKDENQQHGSREFDRAFIGHAGFILSNIVRSFFLAITGARIAKTTGSSHSRIFFAHLTRMSSAFALTADITMILLGSALKRKERISARLADALSYMYLAASVIKRYEDNGVQKSDLPLLLWGCRYSLFQVQESLYDLFENYPNRIVAQLMKCIIFPSGRSFKPPSDQLDHRVAEILLAPSESRDRLTDGIFIPVSNDEPMGRIEDALAKVIAAEEIEKKILRSVKSKTIKKGSSEGVIEKALQSGTINEDEYKIVITAMNIRKEVIKVDDFPKDRWRREN